MPDQSGTVREIVWQAICPPLLLVRAAGMAFSGRVLLLAAMGLVGMSAGWRVAGAMFESTDDPVLQNVIESFGVWPWETEPAYRYTFGRVGVSTEVDRIPIVGTAVAEGPIVSAAQAVAAPFWVLFEPALTLDRLGYALICALWAALVWALFGGAIARIAGVGLTRGEPVGIRPAIAYARRKWFSYFTAPLLPLVGVGMAAFGLWLLGLAMQWPPLAFVGGLLWPLVLLAGLFMAILAVGLLFGWPLMSPTIGVEGTDAFDAISRSYAYVYQRPLHYFLYVVVASLLGILAVLAIDVFVRAVLFLSMLPVSWGIDESRLAIVAGSAPEGAGWADRAAAGLIGFFNGCVRAVLLGFPFGLLWTSATGIYLLLRRNVDATDLDEVHLTDREEIAPPPELPVDDAGVPGAPEE